MMNLSWTVTECKISARISEIKARTSPFWHEVTPLYVSFTIRLEVCRYVLRASLSQDKLNAASLGHETWKIAFWPLIWHWIDTWLLTLFLAGAKITITCGGIFLPPPSDISRTTGRISTQKNRHSMSRDVNFLNMTKNWILTKRGENRESSGIF